MLEAISIGEPLVGIYGMSGKNLTVEAEYRRVLGGDTSNFALALTKLDHTTGYVTKLVARGWGRYKSDKDRSHTPHRTVFYGGL